MKIITADFITSAKEEKQYPSPDLPEFAFVGRSNVGKSSLINSLLVRKKLVKTSATPGKTQLINFFKINDAWMFADLPGYGFAKVPNSVKSGWQKMIENYLLKRSVLKLVVFIVDLRRKPSELDFVMRDWLIENNIGFVVVATKADKLSQHEKKRQRQLIEKTYAQENNEKPIIFSSKQNWGRKELWDRISVHLKPHRHTT